MVRIFVQADRAPGWVLGVELLYFRPTRAGVHWSRTWHLVGAHHAIELCCQRSEREDPDLG